MDKHSNDNFYTQERLVGVNFPFIAPFRTQRLKSRSSLWCDDWQIKTNPELFTPGWRIRENPRQLYIFHMDHGYLHHCTANHGRTKEEIDLLLAISTKSEHK